MRSLLFDDELSLRPLASAGLATRLATLDLAHENLISPTRTLVGRPGLDPGTLGLKEACIWSDWSGGVGIIRESKKTCPVVSDSSGGIGLVCGMKCGKCERSRLFSMRVHVGPVACQ